ncbi:MAG TPA: hypothetical protein VFM88_07930 [Vicinamibacteria bacterium]|nr:hypothetical protein [Vicinamibacteria bacterium]
MVRLETRPLTAEEEGRLLDEAGAGPSRGETGCMAFISLVAIPALGWLVADNLVAWLGVGSRWAGLAFGLAAGLAWGAFPMALMGRRSRAQLRESQRQKLAAAPVERWAIEPSRAWDVQCSATRALLFELSDHRLVLVASRHLERLPPSTFPRRLEIEALPQLDRVLALSAAEETRPTETFRPTLEELGNDEPLKKRRFVELAPEGLDRSTLAGLGLPPGAPGSENEPVESGLPRDVVVERSDETTRVRRLTTPAARWFAMLLTWIVPALAFVAIAGCRARGLRPPPDGASASLFLLFVVSWLLAVIAADFVRWRSAFRVLARGHGSLIHIQGRLRVERSFPAPLTGRAAALARADLLLGPRGVMQAVEFAVEAADGSRTGVDVRHAWLLDEGDLARRVVRVETAAAERLVRGADGLVSWYRRRRWQYPLEGLVQDGDRVHLLGRRAESGRVSGSAAVPLFVWRDGARLMRWPV